MGGSQYQIKCLLDELLALNRYEITYLANRTTPDFVDDRYSVVPIGRKVPRFGYLMHAIPLYRALRHARPDVIYQRVACGYTAVAAHYARRHGARFIWHVAHDSDVSPDSSIHGRNPLRRFLEKRSVEYGIRNTDQIVTHTEHQAALLHQNYDRVADAMVPNFHPFPTERNDKSGPLTVLWVANLKPWKRPEAFVRLAESLLDLEDVRFMMVGALSAGAQEWQWEETLLTRMEETPNLDYLGRLTQDQVNELMARAHVFVNTSRREGFAKTFIQAWMREVPVVTLSVNPDGVLDRERVGICAGSEERLSDAVRTLLTNAPQRQEYAARACAYAAKKHSLHNALLLADMIDRSRIANHNAGIIGVDSHIR